MLPVSTDSEVLRQLRKAHVDSRVLILTARGELNDRVNGLAIGADDYLAKPFAMQELVARVAALGRRSGCAEKSSDQAPVADLTLDLTKDNEVFRGTAGSRFGPRADFAPRIDARARPGLFSNRIM